MYMDLNNIVSRIEVNNKLDLGTLPSANDPEALKKLN